MHATRAGNDRVCVFRRNENGLGRKQHGSVGAFDYRRTFPIGAGANEGLGNYCLTTVVARLLISPTPVQIEKQHARHIYWIRHGRRRRKEHIRHRLIRLRAFAARCTHPVNRTTLETLRRSAETVFPPIGVPATPTFVSRFKGVSAPPLEVQKKNRKNRFFPSTELSNPLLDTNGLWTEIM